MVSAKDAAFNTSQATMQRHAALMKMARGGKKGGANAINTITGASNEHNELIAKTANMQAMQTRNATFDKNIKGGRRTKKRRTNKKRK
jgi:hypothetical protein